MNSVRGSTWRRWDLHVHTPASIVQNYNGDEEEAWVRWVSDVEALPESIRVLGINDYWFLDGYKRVLEFRNQGRLQNLELILPVVELRLAMFAGSGAKVSRINLHVIFSNEISADVIEAQFLSALAAKFQVEPGVSNDFWGGTITRAGLVELGQKIIQNTPDEKRPAGGALMVGFSNLALKMYVDEVRAKLDGSHQLKDKYVLAAGKAEWDQLRWDQAAALKKDLIFQVGLLFSAAESPEALEQGKSRLMEEGIDHVLLDCSDAHHFADSDDKDRLGNCATWLKADTTFQGLLHSLEEPSERIFVGPRPPLLDAVDARPDMFFESVKIQRKALAERDDEHRWFEDVDLQLNSGLVAIIGNKGSGKSALADIISACASAKVQEFTFLNDKRFRRQNGRPAADFRAVLSWHDGVRREFKLEEDVPAESVERVKYIPQRHFQNICDDLGGTRELQSELETVAFSHIPRERKGKHESFRALVEYLDAEIESRRAQLRTELRSLNAKIVKHEDLLAGDRMSTLQKTVETLEERLEKIEAAKPEEVPEPRSDSEEQEEASQEHSELVSERDELETIIEQIAAGRARAVERADVGRKAINLVEAVSDEWRERKQALQQLIAGHGINVSEVVEFTITRDPLDGLVENASSWLEAFEAQLDAGREGSVAYRKDEFDKLVEESKKALRAPERRWTKYQEELKEWRKKKEAVIGSKDLPDTLEWAKAQIARLRKEVPKDLQDFEEQRWEISQKLHATLVKQRETFDELLGPVRKAIEDDDLAHEKYAIEFQTSLRQREFATMFLGRINQGRTGSFKGVNQGEQRVQKLLMDCDFDDWSSTKQFLETILENLYFDQLDEASADHADTDDAASTLKSGSNAQRGKWEEQLIASVSRGDLYDFLFGLDYLTAEYELRMGGKSLDELSAGERGALLLIFYLLLYLGCEPLVIDQPEENLDNESVYRLLSHCVTKAKCRRQVFVVTHNPNLAVVCDADQVIRCHIDRQNGNLVTYTSGALENPKVNRAVIDVLEGTWPAFSSRQSKYFEYD